MKRTGIETVKVLAIVFALSCLFLLLSSSMPASALAHNQFDSVGESSEMPDLIITAITPYHYRSEEYDMPTGDPWFNLKNYVEVTVGNNGTAAVEESFEVILYIDGELIGSETVDWRLAGGDITNVEFEWEPKPEGEDPLGWTDTAEGAILSYKDTSKTYRLEAFVDREDRIEESNETNNNKLTEQKVVWNGYMADHPLENYVHGNVKGGIIYTTGDGQYRGIGSAGTEYGTYYDINYDLAIPGSAKVARLYIYYTWAQPSYKAPKIGVTLKTPSDGTHQLNMEKSYNDIKGDFGPFRYAWGTYAYDIREYVKESGTYIVRVRNLNDGSDSDFANKYSFAAPAILVVYEDTTAPKREYWINEGADILIGGRRSDSGFLDLEECKNTALFPGSIDLSEVKKATLGVVSVWGGNPVTGWHSYLYFNGNELGIDVYEGYSGSCSKGIGGVSMSIGSDNAQVGIELTEVTDELKRRDNKVIQGDDGDNMMPANAFLVITYEEEEKKEEGDGGDGGEITPVSPNITAWNPAEAVINSIEGESRTFNITVNQTVDISWQINGIEVQKNESVTEAVYTNTSAVVGTWNVSAIATNRETSLSDMHTWLWNVTTALAVTPTPAVNITATPSPTPSNISKPTPTPALTPISTPTPKEEKQKPGADGAPVPGFELALSLFMLMLVAYLIRKENR